MRILKVWTFEWWEVGLIKICLLSLGILLGIYFYECLIVFSWVWLIVFVVTAIYFVVRFFMEK